MMSRMVGVVLTGMLASACASFEGAELASLTVADDGGTDDPATLPRQTVGVGDGPSNPEEADAEASSADGGGKDASASMDGGIEGGSDSGPTPDAGGTPRILRIFLSVGTVRGDLINTLDPCPSEGNKLLPKGTFVALVSRASQAADILIDPNAVYTLPTGQIVGTTQELKANTLRRYIQNSSTYVWTGTDPTTFASDGFTCNNWSTANGDATVGVANVTNSQWVSKTQLPCASSFPVYCIERP